jgi:hypothetical protein
MSMIAISLGQESEDELDQIVPSPIPPPPAISTPLPVEGQMAKRPIALTPPRTARQLMRQSNASTLPGGTPVIASRPSNSPDLPVGPDLEMQKILAHVAPGGTGTPGGTPFLRKHMHFAKQHLPAHLLRLREHQRRVGGSNVLQGQPEDYGDEYDMLGQTAPRQFVQADLTEMAKTGLVPAAWGSYAPSNKAAVWASVIGAALTALGAAIGYRYSTRSARMG